MNANGNTTAFPVSREHARFGLTKREWIAGHVLGGLCAGFAQMTGGTATEGKQYLVETAREITDAMLDALERKR